MGRNEITYTGRKTGRGASSANDEILFNKQELKEAEEKLKKQTLSYVVKVPSARGKGSSVKEIDELARKMKEAYDQVELLIAASTKMLESIGITIEATDDMLAKGYSANGECFTLE